MSVLARNTDLPQCIPVCHTTLSAIILAAAYVLLTVFVFSFALAVNNRDLRSRVSTMERIGGSDAAAGGSDADVGGSASSTSMHTASSARTNPSWTPRGCDIPPHHLSVDSFTSQSNRGVKTRSYVFVINGPYYDDSPIAPRLCGPSQNGDFQCLDEFALRIHDGSPVRSSIMAARDAIDAVGRLPSDPHLTSIELVFKIDTDNAHQCLEPISVRSVSPSGYSSSTMTVMSRSHMSDLIGEIESMLPEFKSISTVTIKMSYDAQALLYMAFAGI